MAWNSISAPDQSFWTIYLFSALPLKPNAQLTLVIVIVACTPAAVAIRIERLRVDGHLHGLEGKRFQPSQMNLPPRSARIRLPVCHGVEASTEWGDIRRSHTYGCRVAWIWI
jgi:hypothetical protein